MDRRRFIVDGLKLAGAAATAPWWLAGCGTTPEGALVNDLHSQLNATQVSGVVRPASVDELTSFVRGLGRSESFAVAGGRHAMGGQQFAAGSPLVDMGRLNHVLGLDVAHGVIEVEAGIHWPELVGWLNKHQSGATDQWGIAQKQTGADRLSVGGGLAANIHGRGLAMKPLVGDIESFTLVSPDGRVIECSRTQNADQFRLAIGGYGLFGVIATARLRLMPRVRVERVVEIVDTDTLADRVAERIDDGFLYGDGQFAIDPESPDFLRRCVFSTYRPASADIAVQPDRRALDQNDWRRLLAMAHTDKSAAFEAYAAYYLSTTGQVYWSDTHQMSTYIDDYHVALDQQIRATERGTEMISEIYTPRDRLPELMARLRDDFRQHEVDVIYGTVRFIEQDDETFLPWARKRYACLVFNFHVVHSPAGIDKAQRDFQRLIDHALEHDGSYFLTYHRWARRDQVERAYPQFAEFLRLKRDFDPRERLQSDWYRHYQRMFG